MHRILHFHGLIPPYGGSFLSSKIS